MIERPFEGIKVIELASVLAGPAVGMFFAELGADVLKIENPRTGGDITRQWKLPQEDRAKKDSAYFNSVNWGKSSLFLDISSAEGRDELLRRLQDADVLIMNFKAGDAQKFGLDPDALCHQFPRLLVGLISGYGEQDPRPAFDLVMQAETGWMSMNGTAGSGPVRLPVALIDLFAAHQLKEGLLTALYRREKTGKGGIVQASLFDAAVASLANQASNFLVAGKVAGLEGSLHPNIAPYGETFSCADGRYIVLAVGTDGQFARLCKSAGMEQLATDERFSTNPARVVHRASLYEALKPFFTSGNSTETAQILEKAEVPFAIVRTIGELLSGPAGGRLVLDGKCVRTAVFTIRNSE